MTKEPEKNFEKKIWIASAIVALFIILLWIIKVTFNVFLLILAGALIALFFRGLSGLIQRKTKLNDKLSLAISILGSLLLVALFFWFAGNRIQQQAGELTKTLPQTIDHFKTQLNNSFIGQQVVEKISSQDNTAKASSFIKSFFNSTFGVLGDIYVVLFIGIFFTVSPKTYVDGFIKLVPTKAKSKTEEVVNKVSATLTKWLKGQFLAMLIVAVLTGIGLTIIGMPMALVLALIAGLLNFIPNFGPLIAMIPAILVALMQGLTTALIVAALYIFVQMIESNLITPQIQKKLINIPPALIIIAQLFMGVLTGGLGLILATPLTAILMVVIQETYVKKQE
ncbi:MAG: AI-2E family transporter [Bacteroidota bacterium]|nr:AI-2E family transporter [Bacteroidota bacterium]